MRAYFNGREVTLRLNGKRVVFHLGNAILDINNELITADGLKFLTADGNRFLVKGG